MFGTEKIFQSSGYFGYPVIYFLLFLPTVSIRKLLCSFLISTAKREICGDHAVILFSFKACALSTFPQALPGWITSLSEHPTSGRGGKIPLTFSLSVLRGFLQYLTQCSEETAWIWRRMAADKKLPSALFAKPQNMLRVICFI